MKWTGMRTRDIHWQHECVSCIVDLTAEEEPIVFILKMKVLLLSEPYDELEPH